jgi:L-seryl-tRNA(Ser) seleniumtransferase
VPGFSTVGGGAFPGAELPTTLVTLEPASCDALLAALRAHDPPVIARVEAGRVVLDPRTVAEDELPIVVAAVRAALHPAQGDRRLRSPSPDAAAAHRGR